MSDWLAIGPADNWEIGTKKKVWAVGVRLANSWAKVEPGDKVFCYAIAPIKGLIGYAIVQSTTQSKSPFWPQEKMTNEVL